VQVFNADATPDGSNVVISEAGGKIQYSVELANLTGNSVAATWSDFDNVAISSEVLTRVFEVAPSFSDGNDYIDGTNAGETMDGLGGNDYILALSGDDIIFGRDGADWIVGGGGADQMDGGSGTDMVSFVDMPQGVIADMAAGTAQVANTIDTFTNFENLTGSIYGDYIVGDDGNNRLRGLGDYDWMVGSGGADSFDGGTGRDMVSYVFAETRVVVDLGLGQGLEGQALGDTYANVERLTGSIYSDLFYGADGAEDFRGLGGDDWFVGSGGGKDRYDGGTGRDTVSYSSSSAGVNASLLLGRGLTGDAARDLYTNVENLTGTSFVDTLTGDNGRNVLRGFAGDDVIYGNGGADRITGGRGDDTINGGSGWDYAFFSEDRDAYSVVTNGAVTTVTQLTGTSDGTDTLTNMEVLVFADETIFL
jgi:Ca2+-binding RTX toxin-like protein